MKKYIFVLTWFYWWGYSANDVTDFMNKIPHPQTAKIVCLQNPENWCVIYEADHPVLYWFKQKEKK